MPSFVVNPADQTVVAVEPEGDFLDAVRREIGAVQTAVVPVSGRHFAVWCDAMGLLKPGRDFWRFSDSEHRFAGKCLITGLDDQGRPIPFGDDTKAEDLHAVLVFHPSSDLLAIVEHVVIAPDDDGKPVPAIAREVRWKEQPEAAVPVSGGGWTVFERANGTYRAILYEVREDETMEAMQMVSAQNLEELHKLLPPGLVRHEPGELDAPEVVEHFLRAEQ